MSGAEPSAGTAETRLARLLERLLSAAEQALAAGDLDPARATAEEVAAVDPGNERAADILQRIAARSAGTAGERALMSLLFSDIVGSTVLSEQVEPERLRDLYALYRTAVREAVERYGGTVIQYSGDGVLAGFGYPDAHEDDARRAVLAGLDLVAAMRDSRPELHRRLGVSPQVRVGIHSGRVVVTDLSADPVKERDSIVGFAPNLAARIQQNAEPDTVVVSDVTRQLVDTDFYLRSLGDKECRGVSRLVEVFAVDRPRYAGARFEAERYRKAGLVGRDDPRSTLVAAWERVRDAAAAPADDSHAAADSLDDLRTVAVVAGEAGIGKTRLVAELLDRVEAGGGTVLSAGCLPYYATVSLWPVARMLERELALAGDDDRAAALVAHLRTLDMDLSRTVPFFAALLGVATPPQYPVPELDPAAFLDETLTRLVVWLGAIAARKPRLLVVEDLHWADSSTVALLGRLAQRRPRGVLTVATTREPAAIPWLATALVVDLQRLDDDAASRLVDNLAEGRDLAPEVRASIVARGEGVPLFVEELTRSQLDEDRDEPMPLRLQELFTWRLRSPGVDLRTVQAAATLGPTFDASTLTALLGDADSVTRQLGVLVAEGVVEPGDPVAGTYRFRHALLRDAAYETQVLDVRSDTHAAVAEVMHARGAEPALVAQHLDLAGDAKGAANMYLVAAQGEQGRGAHVEAAELLTRALALLEQLPESEERDLSELTDRMLRALSVSSMQGYASLEVQADHRRAELLARRLTNRPEVLPSLIAIWAYWFTSGELTTSAGLVQQLAAMAQQPTFAWFQAEVETVAGYQALYEGRLLEAQDQFTMAIDRFRTRPLEQSVSPFWPLPNDPIAVALTGLAVVLTLRGELDRSADWETEALRRTDLIGFPRGPWSRAFVVTYRAWIRRYLGDEEAARRLGAEVATIGQEHGYAYWVLMGANYTAGDPTGPPDAAAQEQAIAGMRGIGQEAFVASNLTWLARLQALAGALDTAVDTASEALRAAHKTGEYLHLPEVLRARGEFQLRRGRPEEALLDLREALSVAIEQGARVARLRVALDIARLPDAVRPDGWRADLDDAVQDMPTTFDRPELQAARSLLAA
jgi:class 3 adenylate cyclase/tetratricopeptide (TPR) repeat protein